MSALPLDQGYAFGQGCFFQLVVGSGQWNVFAESQVEVGNVVGGEVMFPCQGFQRDVLQPFSAYHPGGHDADGDFLAVRPARYGFCLFGFRSLLSF